MPAIFALAGASGGIYPDHLMSNGRQAATSAYYGRDYAEEAGLLQPPSVQAEGPDDDRMRCVMVQYLMSQMEPTDRCLRMPGDYYPADGTFPGRRDGSAAAGTSPWDGVSPAPECARKERQATGGKAERIRARQARGSAGAAP